MSPDRSGAGTNPGDALSLGGPESMFLPRALIVSVLLHALVVAATLGIGALRARALAAESTAAPVVSGAALSGDTFEVEAVRDEPPAPKGAMAPAPAAAKRDEQDPAPATPPEPKPAEREPKKARPAKRAESAETQTKPTAPAAPATAAGETETEAEPSTNTGAKYGAAGLPPGVRHLASAFTKAVSAATNRDPLWDGLPIGSVGTARIVIDVDEDGRITQQPFDEDDEIAAPLVRLVERTLLLLRAGRFALSHERAGAGREILEIEVTLSMVTPPEGEWDDPTHTAKIGFVPPAPGVPGRAYFVHASGRRFDARVTIVKSTLH